MQMRITSEAFADGETIPVEYTADGDKISPPLAWSGQPKNAESLALICEDPDAPSGLFVHWVVFNIPPSATSLPKGASRTNKLPAGAVEGTNGAGRVGYTPPAPPSGVHHYIFRIYALDTTLDRREGMERASLLQAMKGHILAEGQITGRYGRK